MPDDEFNLDDAGFESDSEESLDDFFQPAGTSEKEGGEDPAIDDFFAPPSAAEGPETSTERAPAPPPASAPVSAPDHLPIEKERVADLPAESQGLEAAQFAPAAPMEADEEQEAPVKEKGFLGKNWLLLLIGFLVIIVGGAGGYLAVDYFILNKKTDKVAQVKPPQKPSKRPKAKPAAKKPVNKKKPPPASPTKKPSGLSTKKGDEKNVAKTGKEKPKKAAPVAAKTTKKTKPAPKPKKKSPRRSGAAVASTGGDYSVQVGSYMLEASKKGPENLMRQLGYSDHHYVPYSTTLKIYHVLAGKKLSREAAGNIIKQLKGMGYVPELWPESEGYKVLVYSYGSYSVAKSTRRNVTKAGISPVTIKTETKRVSLDQLRIGSYASRLDAKKALGDLKRHGFKKAVIVKE